MPANKKEDAIIANLEALLYSSARPMSVEELSRASGTDSKTKTANCLQVLQKKIKNNMNAVELRKLRDGNFVLQLKPEYISITRQYASKPLLPKATLKTLSYIAYMQPVSSKQVAQVRGTGAYLHLQHLEQLEFVEYQKVGRMKIYTTTSKFEKYFEISANKETLKQKLFTKMKVPHSAIDSLENTQNTQQITPKQNAKTG